MKKTLFAGVMALVATICLPLSAQAADYSLNVANFCELTVVDGVPVDYVCCADSAGMVVFSAEPGDASKITFSNNKEHLRIQSAADDRPLKGLPRVRVYSASRGGELRRFTAKGVCECACAEIQGAADR